MLFHSKKSKQSLDWEVKHKAHIVEDKTMKIYEKSCNKSFWKVVIYKIKMLKIPTSCSLVSCFLPSLFSTQREISMPHALTWWQIFFRKDRENVLYRSIFKREWGIRVVMKYMVKPTSADLTCPVYMKSFSLHVKNADLIRLEQNKSKNIDVIFFRMLIVCNEPWETRFAI